MKRVSLLFTALATVGLALPLAAQEKSFYLQIENPWDQPKSDYPVVVQTADLKCDFPILSATVFDGEQEIASQTDDLDRDGKGDEIAFLVELPAQAKKEIRIVVSAQEAAADRYPARVYADMKLVDKSNKREKHPKISMLTVPGNVRIYNNLYHHGPAFESELVAYRLYFDQKQTVDIYGKYNKGLEIGLTGWYPDDKQLASGFGNDVLVVGSSCGVGALKGWDAQQGKATHIEPVLDRTARILAYGPVRTVCEMEARGWEYGGRRLTMTCRYILYGGHRDAQVDVFFDQPLEQETFCTGVVKIKDSQSYSDHQGLVGCWGTDWPETDTIKWHKETVGLGTCIPEAYVSSEINVDDSYLYQIQAPGKNSLTYYITFTSLKETFGYKTPEEWFAALQTWKTDLNRPCTVRLLSKKK
ncbi:MAG: DUF4861 domain-containing protein [Porphyromonadaceae bacterium]|nr:DUF4861 domain-containing protein [Porphyromonadaceae bacterium]